MKLDLEKKRDAYEHGLQFRAGTWKDCREEFLAAVFGRKEMGNETRQMQKHV